MEVKELRIGNYVYAFKTIYQIDETDFIGEKISTYKPIPLTEEILLKCGFEKIIDNEFTLRYDLKKDPRFDYFFPKHNLKSFGLRFHGSTFFDVVKYLHQLQNFHFALTNEELIINL